MSVEIITREDLQAFRLQLLNDLKGLLQLPVDSAKEWLKGREVQQLLKISHGTLQNLRVNGHLYYSKVGGTYYYKRKDILKMLEDGVEAFR